MGDSHIRRRLPVSVADKISNKSKDELNIDLFNSNDYGYYKCSNWDSIKNLYPFDETKIPVESFDVNVSNKKAVDCQKLFNSEKIGLELNKYSEFINNSEPVFDYILTKENFGGLLSDFKEFKTRLNYFLN